MCRLTGAMFLLAPTGNVLTGAVSFFAPTGIAGSAPPSCELCLTAMQVQMLGSSEMDQEVVGAKGAGGES